MDVVAVDWSGAARGAAGHIWSAHVSRGRLIALESGRERSEVVDDLIALRPSCPDGLCVGLDFAFSFPAWFARQQGCRAVEDVWSLVAQEGEGWLAQCAPPFWGRPGHRRPELPEHLRQAERQATVAGISAKSVFQIGGAGSVGTGSLRGMPHLQQLHRAGFSIWPFHPAAPQTVVEIYPRLLTGPVHKSNRQHRAAYLRAAPWPIPPPFVEHMVESEDAFDAGISALMMDQHADELIRLGPATDPVTRLEGDVWRPAAASPATVSPASS
jgi:hypothetical protein